MAVPALDWLEKKNHEYGDAHMPHGQRPWQAWSDWGRESGHYMALGHPDVKAIFDWFALQSPEAAQQIGPAYVGVYYFDGAVWPLIVPVVFGVAQVNALEMLKTMPAPILSRLKSSAVRLNDLAGLAHDCIDYAFRFRDGIAVPTLSAFSRPARSLGPQIGVSREGDGSRGQIGDGTNEQRLQPKAVARGLTFDRLSAGFRHTCGETNGNRLYCWGSNRYGQLGDGTTVFRRTPVAVAGGLTFKQVGAGTYHTCGKTSGDVAYCWGRNDYGQVGDGTTTQRLRPTPVAAPQ